MEKLTAKEVKEKMEEFNKNCIKCDINNPNKNCYTCKKLIEFSKWYQGQPIRIQL